MLEDQRKEIIFTKVSLAFLTSPFLLTLMTAETIYEGLKEIGEISEEIFRGERLPLLKLTELK